MLAFLPHPSPTLLWPSPGRLESLGLGSLCKCQCLSRRGRSRRTLWDKDHLLYRGMSVDYGSSTGGNPSKHKHPAFMPSADKSCFEIELISRLTNSPRSPLGKAVGTWTRSSPGAPNERIATSFARKVSGLFTVAWTRSDRPLDRA